GHECGVPDGRRNERTSDREHGTHGANLRSRWSSISQPHRAGGGGSGLAVHRGAGAATPLMITILIAISSPPATRFIPHPGPSQSPAPPSAPDQASPSSPALPDWHRTGRPNC